MSSIKDNLKNIVGGLILFAKKVIIEDVNPPGIELPKFQDSFLSGHFVNLQLNMGVYYNVLYRWTLATLIHLSVYMWRIQCLIS